MSNLTSAGRLGWQRNPIFQFFASVRLAVVLLLVIIVASIVGTIYESSFDAKIARAYVYGAPWFNIWLLLLVANLACAAFSRWPWRQRHVAFLVTHLGIIILLTGAFIGRIWGIEGTITLFKGDPPSNRLLIDERQLRVQDTDGIIKGFPVEFLNRKPSQKRPRDLGKLASGAHLSIVEYAEEIQSTLNPRPVAEGGVPAVQIQLSTAMMNQRLNRWLLADGEPNGVFDLGLAKVEVKRGAAASTTSADAGQGEIDLQESIFAFSKAPDQQISRVVKGGSTGARIFLSQAGGERKGEVVVRLGEQEWRFDLEQSLGEVDGDHRHPPDLPLNGSGLVMRVESYWPDFRVIDGKPGTVSEQPNNPAVVVTLHGRGVPTAPAAAGPHADAANQAGANHLTIFVAEDGVLSYELRSRSAGPSSGTLQAGQSLPTGWADWQVTVNRVLPAAEHWMDFTSVVAGELRSERLPAGVKVRVEQSGKSFEQWIPTGWQVSVPTSPAPTQIAYGWRSAQLPIALELLDFEVKRNEGSDSPAGFKSTLRVSDTEGRSATGACWMNNPFSFPTDWWRPWTGLTYKISQASWNPENLNQSTVQILRDPGWSLKWIGSLLVCTGVFLLFYVKRFRRPGRPAQSTTATVASRVAGREREPAVTVG